MKRNAVLAVLIAGVAGVGFFLFPIQGQGQGAADSESVVQRGFAAVPDFLQLNLAKKNRSLVGEGSYYVNGISACVGCHNADPNNVTAANYLTGGQSFGPVQSRNLTPDAAGRPAGLTLSEFKEVIRFGTDFDHLPPNVPGPGGRDILIVMPWPELSHGTDRYIESIYEYLSTLPCHTGGPALDPHRLTRCNGQ